MILAYDIGHISHPVPTFIFFTMFTNAINHTYHLMIHHHHCQKQRFSKILPCRHRFLYFAVNFCSLTSLILSLRQINIAARGTFQQMGSFLKLKMWTLSRLRPLMGRSAKYYIHHTTFWIPILYLPCLLVLKCSLFLIIYHHFHPVSSTFIHFHPFSFTFIHFHPLCLSLNHLECTWLYLALPGSALVCFRSPWTGFERSNF